MRRALAFIALIACGGSDARTAQVAPSNPTCPEGTIYNGVACAEPLTGKAEVAPAPQPAPVASGIDPVRDPRRLGPRSIALLDTELPLLERLQAATAQSSPDYSALARRIAETYFELAYANAGDAPAASQARKKAIAQYLIARSNPSFAQMDDVLYYLAYAYELEGELSQSRKTYYELIQKFPTSKKIALAYYAFGEMFVREAQSDPTKWQLAKQAYLETLKLALADLQPWALLRIGQAEEAVGDTASAQQHYAKLKAQFPQSPATAQIK